MLFTANVLIAPAFCQQFRQGARAAAQGATPAADAAQAPDPMHHGGHHAHAVPPAETHSTAGHRHPDGHTPSHLDGANCDFCLLTSLANTALPARLAAPVAVSCRVFACTSSPGHAAGKRLPLIRAPPSLA